MSYDRSPDDELWLDHDSAWSPRRINLAYWQKPLPWREFDWQATYAGDQPDAAGRYAVGYGATRAEAIADLLDNYPRDELIEELREFQREGG